MRIGQGYDVHKLVPDRELILGGVTIPYEKGLLGHSDADVLVHAVMDALLGAAALGDIGQHFPDTDPAYEGASSIELLKKVGKLLQERGYVIENIDATIIAQRPKLAAYRPQMAENIADALGLPVSRVSVKATTEEGLGFTGSGEGISKFANSFDLRRLGVRGWGWFTALGLLLAVVGFVSFMDPVAGMVAITAMVGVFLLLQGFASILRGLFTKRFWLDLSRR